MPIARSVGILVFSLALFAAGPTWAADRKQWVTLENCQYLEGPDNDGDSFRVRGEEKEFIARLYHVDALETNLKRAERTHEQSLYFGITLDETMKAGTKAKERVQALLQKPFLVRTRWATAGGQGREPRYYIMVEVDGKSLADLLVSEGLARIKGVSPNLPSGEKATAYKQRLKELEDVASQKRLGAWATSTIRKTDSEAE